jgi:HAD domain in Swiss Army Knife RNA repair proteins
MTKPKVVFLDIDGPIINAGCYGINKAASLSRRVMNTSAIGWVNILCEFSEAKLVTNSTHNRDDATMSVRDLKGDLINWGLKKEYFHEDWRTKYATTLFDRHVAIQHWLDKNGDHDWVCFDDYFFKDDPRLVLVDMNDGITYNDFKKAAEIFGIENKLSFLI